MSCTAPLSEWFLCWGWGQALSRSSKSNRTWCPKWGQPSWKGWRCFSKAYVRIPEWGDASLQNEWLNATQPEVRRAKDCNALAAIEDWLQSNLIQERWPDYEPLTFFYFFKFFIYFLLFRATPTAYGGSQARGPIRATLLAYTTATATVGSEPCLQPTP